MDMATYILCKSSAKKYADQVTQSLMGGVHYRGSVNYYDNLPNGAQEGDSYTVKYAGASGSIADGTEYTWGYDTDLEDYTWISFSKDAYSKSETDNLLAANMGTIDAALSAKQNTISDLATIRSGAALGTTAVQPVSGKGLSTNDYSNADKAKLESATTSISELRSDISDQEETISVIRGDVDEAGNTLANHAARISAVEADVESKVDKISGKGLSTNDFTTAEKEKLDNHVVDTSNPHNVTKAQVGLGNVDNTSDAEKPVSKRAQTEFNRDRNAITELIDSGTKNMLQISCSSQTINGVVFTVNDDRTITAEIPNDLTENAQLELLSSVDVPERWKDKWLMLSGTPTGGGSSTWRMVLQNTTSGYTTIVANETGAMPFTVLDNVTRIRLIFTVYANCPAQTITIKPMVCTTSVWNISQQYVPYRPSYDELVARIEALEKAGE